jgi:hypothetical protein
MIKIEGKDIEVIDVHVHPPDQLDKSFKSKYDSIEDELIWRVDEAGIDKVVLLAVDLSEEDYKKHEKEIEYYSGNYAKLSGDVLGSLLIRMKYLFEGADVTEEQIKKFTNKYPDRVIGFGSINPIKVRNMLMKN